jgi:hypothetical protein
MGQAPPPKGSDMPRGEKKNDQYSLGNSSVVTL